MNRFLTHLSLGIFFSAVLFPFSCEASGKVVLVHAPHDAWQVRSLETQKIIEVIRDPKATEAQHAKAVSEFDARLTAAEKGELTPIETMELFGLFYMPKDLQSKTPNMTTNLQIIATQATLGWYDALRFADDSGRAEIVNNNAFFTLPFDQNLRVFVQFMEDHPEESAAAVLKGIQYARDKIKADSILYDQHWPASYGLLRMQCGLKHAKTCETPTPQPSSEWPALLDKAAKKVTDFYRVPKKGD